MGEQLDSSETLALSSSTKDGPPILGVDTRTLALAQVRDPKRYLILGEHGRGALGKVTRAHDRELGRDVAIKELISPGELSEVRFLREALITARLEHPGIVAVHEAGRWPDGTPFYAMKLVSGRPLRELIAARETAEDRMGLLHHVIAVADAIAYAHGRRIVHRDLKPANIIVGDFGETVVIDWGLAKDLTEGNDLALGSGRLHIRRDSELTAVGSVVGTPAYMAPEQARGEYVDQRADVFAIGAMLWELCALGRVPQAAVHQRRRMLRRAGIDRDLAVIIDKALAPDPARRYPDAGALATDLKAFKAGARIAARHYSLVAMLAHWIRRHRALAVSVTAAIALATTGIVVFVRNIAIERDRAEAANDARTLDHAELLLHTDPTAARAALANYHGTDEVRRQRLMAEARGRGVASAVYAPNSDTVWFLHGDKTGAIVSVGEDRRIQLTQGRTSTTLATDVSTSVRVAYAPSRNLLAYATSPAGIAAIDLGTRIATRLSDLEPAVLELAPDGSRLAVLDGHGELEVRPTDPAAAPLYRARFPGAMSLRFATPARLLVLDRAVIRAIVLDASGGAPDLTTLSGVTAIDARPEAAVAGLDDGSIALLSPSLVVLGRTSVCRTRLRTVRFIPHSDALAFACQSRLAGLVRYDRTKNFATTIEVFDTRGQTYVTPDTNGRYVAMTDESNVASLYDTETRLMSHYDGSAGQPSYIAAPTPEFDHVLIGDVNGAVRVWDAPGRAARVVLQAPDAIFRIAFTADSKALVSGGADGIVRLTDLGERGTLELQRHDAMVFGVRVSRDGGLILSFSYDGTVYVWRAGDLTLLRRFTGHESVVESVDTVERGRRVVSVGDDGRLLAWSPDSTDVSVLFEHAHASPLTGVVSMPHNDRVVVKDAAGSMWEVSLRGEVRKVRDGDGADITALRVSLDGAYVAIGTDTGTVAVYETSSWDVVKTLTAEGSIRQIQFDPLNRDMLVASEAGRTQFGHVQIVPLGGPRALRWQTIAAAVRDVAYTPDGETIGFVCADGGTWLYSTRGDLWAYTRDHDTDTFAGRFSPDGRWFASSDRRGVVVVRNVASTLAAAARRQPAAKQAQ